MNGPEHYAEAERLLTAADALVEQGRQGGLSGTREETFARAVTAIHASAQVHATLADTAARMYGALETSDEKILLASQWRTTLGVR